ncbi:hypothetical protein [Melissospora conviva]|jgi:hypothetical protein|uniref:hypothetical protein n=1 Tax=Melissospora conviva TaxID=3388432 RepID=UPI003B7EF5B8
MNQPFPDPFAGEPAWVPRRPRPVRLVPAVGRSDLRGRRVVAGLPGFGWRTDLRADEPIVRNSRTFIPVLPEQEWYRAEAEQVEVFAPLMPVDRIWVETLGEPEVTGSVPPEKLVSLDLPAHRPPTAVVEADSLCGRRVVQMADGAERRDLRAVTETYAADGGDICVRVTAELDWYRWAWRGQVPATREVPVHLLWVE